MLTSNLDGSAPLDEQETKLYQAMTGSLTFLTQCTRFDIAFSTMQAARHMVKPTTVRMAGVKRIFRYLRGTQNLPTIYKKECNFDPVGYCTASHGIGDPEKMRSVTAGMFFISWGLVHFSSQLQKKLHLREQQSPNSTPRVRARNKAFTCQVSSVNWAGSSSEP